LSFPEVAENIMDILDPKPNPTECMVLPHSPPFFLCFFVFLKKHAFF